MNSIDSNIVVISGPSGCGKDTVVKRMLQMDDRFVLSVSATTRPKRPIETDGVDYIFLTTQEFLSRITAGDFLEHTLYCNNYYGTLKQQIEDKVNGGK
ncbi:MAG: guanylate kinase, partial [Oscillospiraceae bacterium]